MLTKTRLPASRPSGSARNKPALRPRPAAPRRGSYVAYWNVGPVERIEMVREGLPAKVLSFLAEDMDVARERLYAWLGIARATANRKLRGDERLSQDESERALGMARLVGQVERIVADSGVPTGFDAAKWTAQWLERPNRALGGRSPGQFLDTADGRALVSSLVGQMQSGAYA